MIDVPATMDKTLLQQSVAALALDADPMSAQEVVRLVQERFGKLVALSSSFGAEDMVLIDMLMRVTPRARIVTLDTESVSVPGVFGLGAGFTSAIVPCTTAPAGITTRPAAFFTSSTTRAVKGSPGLAVREVMVSVAAMSACVPAGSTSAAGAAGFGVAGRGVGGGGVRSVTCGVAGGTGTSRNAADDSAGASVKLRALESAAWPACCSWAHAPSTASPTSAATQRAARVMGSSCEA